MRRLLTLLLLAAASVIPGVVRSADPNGTPPSTAYIRGLFQQGTAGAARTYLGFDSSLTNISSLGQFATNAAQAAVVGSVNALSILRTNGTGYNIFVPDTIRVVSPPTGLNGNAVTKFGINVTNDMQVDGLPIVFETTGSNNVAGVSYYLSGNAGDGREADVGLWSLRFGRNYGGNLLFDLFNRDNPTTLFGPSVVFQFSGKYSLDNSFTSHPVVIMDATNMGFRVFAPYGGFFTQPVQALRVDQFKGLVELSASASLTNGVGTLGATNGAVVGNGTSWVGTNTPVSLGSVFQVGGSGGYIIGQTNDQNFSAIDSTFFGPWSGQPSGSSYQIYSPAFVGKGLNSGVASGISADGAFFNIVPGSGNKTYWWSSYGNGNGASFWSLSHLAAGNLIWQNGNRGIFSLADSGPNGAFTVGGASNTMSQPLSVSGNVAGGEMLTLNGLSQFQLDAGNGQLNLHSPIFNANPVTIVTNAPNGGGDFTTYGLSTLILNAKTGITNANFYLPPIQAGTITNATGSSFNVTFAKSMTGTNYSVSLTADGGAALPYITQNQTTSGFTVNPQGTIASAVNIRWTAVMPTQ